MSVISVCVCGGGHVAHSIVAYLANKGVAVSVFTRRPADWRKRIQATLPDGRKISGEIRQASNDPRVAAGAELIFIAVPRFGMAEVVGKIEPFLSKGQALVAVPGGAGFDWMTAALVRRGVETACLQRVPMICRTEQYGESVAIKGFRKELKMVALPASAFAQIQALIQGLFDTPVGKIACSLSLTLNSSNPILHPARLTTMFKDWHPGAVYSRSPLFYEDWDDQASSALIGADAELMAICRLIPAVWADTVPVLEYYESTGVESLTAKIRSIPSLKGIQSPMAKVGNGWIPDVASRYFTEDVPYGTVPIKAMAELAGVKTPVIDGFIEWVQDRLGARYLIAGNLNPEGCRGLPIPQNYGVSTFSELLGKGATDMQDGR